MRKAIVEYLLDLDNQGDTDQKEQTMQQITILPWQHRPEKPFRIGRTEKRGGTQQLMMDVDVKCGGKQRKLKALIDTGARTNLIKRGLLPEDCFRPARRPLLLKTVSGEELPGGRQEAQLQVTFQAEQESGEGKPEQWETEIVVYGGDIGCDIILGYPWLKAARVDVQPWRDTLQLHDQPRLVLRAEKKTKCRANAVQDEEDHVQEIDHIDTTPRKRERGK